MNKARIHRSLNVWMNGLLVGVWSWDRTDTHQFEYAESWIRSPAARSLSLSLPITAGKNILRGPAVKNYFDNLLPDNKKIRQRISHRYQLLSTNVPDLLEALGRDCVGAVQILPLDMEPDGFDKVTATRLRDSEVEKLLLNVTSDDDSDIIDDFRISLAGAQEKTALLWYEGQWHVPHGATPTTHILKLPLGLIGGMRADMSGSIENEWLCMRIMNALRFEVAKADIAQFGTQKVLVVERFDRKWMGQDWIARLPQEDFCQASGIAPDNKYDADGGPGIAQCLHILEGSVSAAKDKLNFALMNLAFWLLAATDGHAKNF